VLALLSESSGLVEATPLRIFLTSRPEITVRAGLHDMPEGQRRHVILHHVDSSLIDHDIGVFFERNLSSLTHNRTLLQGLPDEEVLQRLVRRADGLFIWAATACRFIKESGPVARRRLDMIITRRVSDAPTSPERKLDAIYTAVLRNALREQFCRLLNVVLGTIAVLVSSLSAPALAALLALSEAEVLDVLCDLHSILDVPLDRTVPIRPQHASVHDFLLSRER
jgi:hypothetical protein